MENLCSFGCGNPAIKYSKWTKNYCCSKSSSSCPAMKKRNSDLVKKIRLEKGNAIWKNGHPRGMKGKKGSNAAIKAKKEGREFLVSAQTREKISKAALGKRLSDEHRENISHAKKALYATGWEPTCGRCKKYDYISPMAGTIKVDGRWELITAHYLDSIGVQWARNRKRFPYIKPDGSSSTYQPDFYVHDWNSYLEVKGYETDLDQSKWSQFPHKLLVWKRETINSIKGKLAELGIAPDC